jgi:hypothetical protein
MGSSARHEVKKTAPKSKHVAAVSCRALDATPATRHLSGTNAVLSRRDPSPNGKEIPLAAEAYVVR